MQKELLKEFEDKFELMKKELKFNSTLDEIDSIFFVRDFIQQQKFVSSSLSRMICSRIVDTLGLWISHMHNWIMPNPASMIAMSENKVFSDSDKEEIMGVMKQFLAFTSRNIPTGITKDRAEEAKFIDDAIKLWKDYSGLLLKFSNKIKDYWKEEAGK